MAKRPSSQGLACERCGYLLEGLARRAERYHCPECGARVRGRTLPGFDADRYMRINIVGTFVAAIVGVPLITFGEFAFYAAVPIGYALIAPVAVAVVLYRRGAEDRRPPAAAVAAAVIPMWIANAMTLLLAGPVAILGLGVFYAFGRL